MAAFTRKAIMDSFRKLLEEKPLKQITIRDIVDDCGINRNTFYYHFQSIPDLIENILEEDSRKLLFENKDIKTIEDCLNLVADTMMRNRRAVLHIYKSANRVFFEDYHWRVCDYVVHSYVDKRLSSEEISETDRKIIVSYIKSLIYGVMTGWLENDLADDIRPFVHRICELKQGDLDTIIEKCKNT